MMFDQLKQKIAFWVLVVGYMAAAWIQLDLMFRLATGFALEIDMTRLLFVWFMFVVALIDKFRKGW